MFTPALVKNCAAVLAGIVLIPVTAWADCIVHYADYNTDRYVYGSSTHFPYLYQECSTGRAPFGNWGVDSNHGGRMDGDQFMGWAHAEGHIEWNTCTKPGGGYEPPMVGYYNWDNNTTQWSDGTPRLYANFYTPPLPWPCSDYAPYIFTLSNYFMQVFELDDFFSDDDFVTTIYYPTFDVVLTCEEYWGTCSGESSWIEPFYKDPDVGTAKIKTLIELLPA